MEPLAELGFNLVGYGCTTCIGNSGPLPEPVSSIVKDKNLVVASVLSRQPQLRRTHPVAGARQLPRVAAAGRRLRARRQDADRPDHASRSASARDGEPVYLRDIWPIGARDPGDDAAARCAARCSASSTRTSSTATSAGSRCRCPQGERFAWDDDSTYIRNPPFFEGLTLEPAPPTDICTARACSRCSATASRPITSRRPDRSRPTARPGKYLIAHGVEPRDFNSYGARRGNHEVMMRGTFANIRLRNQLAPGTEGGWTTLLPGDEVLTIYDASVRYQRGRRAADGHRRQGIRLGIVARLGGEGHAAARRQGGARRELRAHPPQQPREHGRAAAASSRRGRTPRR